VALCIRVAFVGNIANNFFREVNALQDDTRLQSDLYMYHDKNTPNTELPESDIPGYKYPDWIKKLPQYTKAALFSRFIPAILSRRLFKDFNDLIDSLNSYDLCVFSGSEVLLIPFVKTKTVFRATGSDLSIYPVMSYNEYYYMRPGKIQLHNRSIIKAFSAYIQYYIKRNGYRRGVYKSTFIQAAAPPYDWALKRLPNCQSKKINFFRLAIDTKIFCNNLNINIAKNKWGLSDVDFVIFMPSRIMLRDSYLHKITGQWKASDEAIKGFKVFIDKLDKKEKNNILLVLPDRTRSDDLEQAKKLIQELDIEKNIRFLAGLAEEGLTRSELIELYNCSDVVMDDFGVGWFGSVVVEASACGCPIVTYVRDDDMKRKYPWHPIQSAQNACEIAEVLERLYKDRTYLELLSKQSREWALQFHSFKAIRKIYSKQLKKLILSDDFSYIDCNK